MVKRLVLVVGFVFGLFVAFALGQSMQNRDTERARMSCPEKRLNKS